MQAAETTVIEWLELQVAEAWKPEPQLPLGVPKDAKSTLDTTSPAGQPMPATPFSTTSTHAAGGAAGVGRGGAGDGDGGVALIVTTGMDLTSIGGCILGWSCVIWAVEGGLETAAVQLAVALKPLVIQPVARRCVSHAPWHFQSDNGTAELTDGFSAGVNVLEEASARRVAVKGWPGVAMGVAVERHPRGVRPDRGDLAGGGPNVELHDGRHAALLHALESDYDGFALGGHDDGAQVESIVRQRAELAVTLPHGRLAATWAEVDEHAVEVELCARAVSALNIS